MKNLLIILASCILLSCADKAIEGANSADLAPELTSEGTIGDNSTSNPQPADQPALITPSERVSDTDKYVTVIATGFGGTADAALADARGEAVIAASEIAIENGDAYISDFRLIFENLPLREAEFVKSSTTITSRSDSMEIAARVNYTKLTAAINALNAVMYRLRIDSIATMIQNDEAKKARIIKEFAGLFGNLHDVLAVKIESIDYNQAQVKDGKIPFVVSFVLSVDPQRYQQKAQRMIDIVTRELGGELMSSTAVTYTPPSERKLGYYGAKLKDLLNERTYATVITRNGKDVVEIYRLSEHYRRFFNQTYMDELQIGSPYDIQLRLQLSDSAGAVIYEDFMQPFLPMGSDKRNESELEGIYPALYIVSKHEKTELNGRFRIGSYQAELLSVLRLQVGADNSFSQSTLDLSHLLLQAPYKLDVTAPYILANVGSSESRHSSKEIRMQYEGLISVEAVKRLKSVTIQ
ncbi:MAG: hypothetical protein LBV04_06430 [Deferribacteraceae bacterium]|jgi:hypothetical protein|nr:hypothetical protein [Deferribacteraceae bacterium]